MPEAQRRLGPTRLVERWGSFEWTLVAVVALGWAIRLVYILAVRRGHFAEFGVVGDAYFYHRGAQLLAEGKGFIHVFNYDALNAEHVKIISQDASHPPLYILWLWIPSVLGFTGTTAHMLWTSVIGAGTIALAGLAGREMVGPRTGLIAALLAAVYPNVWSHDGFLTSESMAIFTATLAVWLAYRYWRSPTLVRAVAFGAACGLAAMARSELALLVPLVLFPLVLATRTITMWRRWAWLGASLLAVVVLVGPWVGFNLTRFEKPVILSTGFGITLLSATCDRTYYGRDVGYWTMDCTLPVERRIKAWRLDQSVAEAEYRRAALDYIGDHKSRLPVVVLVRWARFTGIWDLTHGFDQVHKDEFPEGREPFVAWTSAIMYLILLPLSVVGAVVLRRRRIPIYPVAAVVLAAFITITITFHQNRYRASAETAFCLLAAVALDASWRRIEARRRGAVTRAAPDDQAELINA